MGRLCLLALCAVSVVSATTKGVKGIDIIVKKHPTGNAITVRTDGGGTARFWLSEPGEYDIEFSGRDASPKAPPEWGFVVALTGEVKVRKAITKTGSTSGFAATDTIALGRMALDANPERIRLAYPRIDLANGIHTERITTLGPVDIVLRLTEDVPDPAVPAITGLPQRLEFVAIEGGPAPARQTIPVSSATGADWQIQFAPVDRIAASFSKPGGRLTPGASDSVDVTALAVGLAPGVYKGQLSILTASNGQTGEPAYVPLYLRILPRTELLDPVVSRRTLVFTGGEDTQSLEVTNPNAVLQTYLLEAADAASARAVRVTPAQLVLQPGQSGRINVSFPGDALGPFTLRLTPQGRPAVNIFARKVPPVRPGCVATELIPVLASVDARIGEDSPATVEVWDNCGTRPRNVVVKVESTDGASFLGINDGISGIKVGSSKTPPPRRLIAIALDPLGGEITGSTPELELGGAALPALADADKPFEIVEIVDAQTGEPGVVAPGAQFVTRGWNLKETRGAKGFALPVQEHEGRSVSIGDRILDIIGTDENGNLIVEVPTDIGPQFVGTFQSTKSGIKTQPRSIPTGPAAPALLLRANPDGTPGTQAPVYKMNGDAREDYALGGGAPPKAGDIIQVEASGLGATDADGNVLGALNLLIGGAEAKVLSAKKAVTQTGCCPGYLVTAELPELKSLDGGTAPVTVKVVVDDIESAEAITPPVEQVQSTTVNLYMTAWSNSIPYKVDGVSYTFPRYLPYEAGAEVIVEATQSYFPFSFFPRYRADFDFWSIGDGGSFSKFNTLSAKVQMSKNMTASFIHRHLYQHTVGAGVSLSPSSVDGFYETGSKITINATCPSSQVLEGVGWVKNWVSAPQTSAVIPASTSPMTVVVHHPSDFTAICKPQAGIALIVTSNPTGLNVRVGTAGNFTPGPVTQQVPAGQTTTIATQTPQVLNGTGYTFTNWSTGGSTPVTTVQPASNFTATANFSVACYVLTINASGGTVTANPPASVTGFQSNCYAPGTAVTLTATPNSGNAFNGWAGDASGTTSPTTITMTGPKTVTANFGAPGNVTLTVTTNPAGLGVRIGASGGFLPGPVSQSIPANQNTTIAAATSQVLNGTGYTFANWSTGGATPTTTVQPSSNFTATANYTVTCHVLTVNTAGAGTVAASPQASLPGFPNNCYAPGTVVTLTATPSQGNTFTSWSGDATGTASPTTVTMDAPKTVTATFGQAQNVTITLTTNPVGLAVRFGASGVFTPGPISQQFPQSNNSMTIATQTPQLLNGTGYNFVNWNTGGSTPVTTMATGSNFTAIANFAVACHTLTVISAGAGTVSASPQAALPGFPNNCYAPGTVVTLTATPNPGNTFTGWAGDVSGNASPTTITMDGPKTVNAAFGPQQNVTLNLLTNPTGLLVQIGNGAFNPSPSAQQVPANQPVSIGTQPQQMRNNTGYSFTNWSTGATTPVTTVTPAANLAATANFTVACYLLAINVSGGGTVAANPPSGVAGFPGACYAPGTVVTLTASANTGSQFTGWSADAAGTAVSTTVTMNAAKTVNAAFGAPTNVTLTVTTNPAGLGVRIGASGAFTAGPLSQQVTAGQTQTIAADSPQVVNGVGYRFTGWSTGGSTPVTTVQPSANFTATANFQVACYLVTFTGTPDGTVALNPATSGISGFPANCYAPGAQVRLLATANTGYGLRDVAINNGGAVSTVTTPNTLITVNSPVTALATFIARPATVSTIFPPVLVSGTTYRSNIFFSNPTPTTGSNLRITNVTFSTTGGSGTGTLITLLPVVFGTIPANGQSSTQQLQFNLPSTLTAYNIFVTVEVQNTNGDTFTNVVSVGHTKP